jgi:hypothetical protein
MIPPENNAIHNMLKMRLQIQVFNETIHIKSIYIVKEGKKEHVSVLWAHSINRPVHTEPDGIRGSWRQAGKRGREHIPGHSRGMGGDLKHAPLVSKHFTTSTDGLARKNDQGGLTRIEIHYISIEKTVGTNIHVQLWMD